MYDDIIYIYYDDIQVRAGALQSDAAAAVAATSAGARWYYIHFVNVFIIA